MVSPVWSAEVCEKVVPGAAVMVMVSPSAGVVSLNVAAIWFWGTTCTGITTDSPAAVTVNEVWVYAER